MATPGKKNKRIVIYLILILVMVAVLVIVLMTRPKAGTPSQQAGPTAIPAGEMVNIVITTQSVAMGVPFTPDVLTTIPYPRAQLVEGTFITDINEVIGKRAKYDLEARIPITSSMLVDQPTGSMASFLVPAGSIAFSIPIDSSNSVSFAPQIGDHVMIIGCLSLVNLDQDFQTRLPDFTSVVTMPGSGVNGGPPAITAGIATSGESSVAGKVEIDPNLNQAVYLAPSEAQRPRIVCQTVIKDATVLHVGQFELEGATLPTDQTTATSSQVTVTSTLPDHITLIVSPQDAVNLTYLIQSNATLMLALRSAGDLQDINTTSTTLQFIMEQKNIQVPASLPYGIYPNLQDEAQLLGPQ
jgi:Flp pilus assembly protein CpaB